MHTCLRYINWSYWPGVTALASQGRQSITYDFQVLAIFLTSFYSLDLCPLKVQFYRYPVLTIRMKSWPNLLATRDWPCNGTCTQSSIRTPLGGSTRPRGKQKTETTILEMNYCSCLRKVSHYNLCHGGVQGRHKQKLVSIKTFYH